MKRLFVVVAFLFGIGIVGLATEHYSYVTSWMTQNYTGDVLTYQSFNVFPAAGGGSNLVSTVNTFPRNLGYGEMNSTDVSLLQEFLLSKGYYSGPITGNYFILTYEGVRRFQRTEGLSVNGYFGTATRALANIRVREAVGDPCRGEGCLPQSAPSPMPTPQPGSITLSSSGSFSGIRGEFMSASVNVLGGSGNYSISYDQTIPGLSYTRTSNSLVISGRPTEAGLYSTRVTATDLARNQSITQTYSFDIRSRPSVSQGTFQLEVDRVTGRYPHTVNLTATLRDMPSCGNTFQWDFGDGTSHTFTESCFGEVVYLSQRTRTVTHTYTSPGSYTARLTIGAGSVFAPISVTN